MKQEEQLQILDNIFDSLKSTLIKKGNDYGKDEDVLSNFKEVSAIAGILKIDVSNPVHYSLFMVILKMCRMMNLLNSNKEVKNEPLEDSFVDGINYMILSYMILVEQYKNEENKNKTV